MSKKDLTIGQNIQAFKILQRDYGNLEKALEIIDTENFDENSLIEALDPYLDSTDSKKLKSILGELTGFITDSMYQITRQSKQIKYDVIKLDREKQIVDASLKILFP